MAEIRSTGGATSETSYYSALENLLNDLGKLVDPNVICNGQLKNQGAGHPDFGLYSRKQCSKGVPKPGQGEIPERGVIEVKPLADNSWQTAKGKQAATYFDRYRLVLVTNYREFRLIGEDDSGHPIEREYFALAPDETHFWAMAAHPIKSARSHGTHLGEFLWRVMMNAAPLTRPEDIAWFLASYAREALATLEEKDGSTLVPLRSSLELALGVKFEGERGEHFFRSTLVQTLFYGIFSAWVIWAKGSSGGKFDWKAASYIITVPMIRSLFEEIAKPSRLAPLGLIGILDRTSEALDRVDRNSFFETFDSGEAVQHFYEPFLEAFDPELRRQMGVWYTPREIVRYMVERIDTVLRTELDIADGLADKNVYVLDPCCGTGAYVVEVLRKIEATLRLKGDDALIGQDVQEAAQKRVFGFEIMSAPFVIAHWQVGNLLAGIGAPIDPTKDERPAIYLTNALTGWEPPSGPKAALPLFPELERERDQAERVKRDVPILVVLGNPPYNAFAGTSPDEEAGLVEPYKDGLIAQWNIKKFNLDDLYVRFFRIAERRIAETGRGVVSYISNYSWTREPSYVVMRQHLLQSFDKLWIENLHGDRNRTEYAPDGTTSETVFAMRGFSPGIRQGVVIGLAVRSGKVDEAKIVRYRNDIDAGRAHMRREQLLDSLSCADFDGQYEIADPQPWNRLSFRPRDVGSSYLAWPKLSDLAVLEPVNGLMEKRGGALIDINLSALQIRMQTYFDSAIDWASFQLTGNPLAKNAARYKAKETREKALVSETFDPSRLIRYVVRPFDVRYAYYTGFRPIWNESRPKLWTQYASGNQFLMTRKAGATDPEGPPTFFTQCLSDDHCLRTDAFLLPFAKHDPADGMLASSTMANLSAPARAWLSYLGHPEPDQHATTAAAPWHHALAITYAPQYLGDNADGIAIDWPRIPLPNVRSLLNGSAALGARVAALLDTEVDLPGVTTGNVAAHLRVLGGISNTDLRVSAGWGRRDRSGRVNPGRGKTVTRNWSASEKDSFRSGFAAEGYDEARAFALLGPAVDIYLNDTTFWRGVPQATWEYVIGGYLVLKKWLSYRDYVVLGRSLTKEEVREVTAMVRRLTALILLSDELDSNYAACRDAAYEWPAK